MTVRVYSVRWRSSSAREPGVDGGSRVILEASTPELYDVVRIEDRYDRR